MMQYLEEIKTNLAHIKKGLIDPRKRIGDYLLRVDDLVNQSRARPGADYLVVHQEGQPHLHRLVGRIRELGAKAGGALNPGTPLHAVDEILPEIDLLLIMSVNPGFGGQAFIPAAAAKLRAARALIDLVNPACLLEIDGGIKADDAALVRAAGVDAIVAGSGISGNRDYRAAIAALRGEG